MAFLFSSHVHKMRSIKKCFYLLSGVWDLALPAQCPDLNPIKQLELDQIVMATTRQAPSSNISVLLTACVFMQILGLHIRMMNGSMEK